MADKKETLMDLHIQQLPGESVRIFCNGELATEIVAKDPQTVRHWEEELRQSRCLQALPKILRETVKALGRLRGTADHNHPTEARKVEAFICGFASGLLGETVEHPVNRDFKSLDLRMQKDHSPSYSRGFERGEAIRQIVNTVD